MRFTRTSQFAVLLVTTTALAAAKPADKTDLEPVTVDGLEFVLATEKTWLIPTDKPTPVTIRLKVTNTTAGNIHFNLFDTITVNVKDSNGRKMQIDGGRNATRPPMPLVIGKDETGTIDRSAELKTIRGKDGLYRLFGSDGAGGVWWYDLPPGQYTLWISYKFKENPLARQPVDYWRGEAQTKELTVEITEKPAATK